MYVRSNIYIHLPLRPLHLEQSVRKCNMKPPRIQATTQDCITYISKSCYIISYMPSMNLARGQSLEATFLHVSLTHNRLKQLNLL